MQTRQRALDREIFPNEDIPQEYLSAPVVHAYRPQLEVFNMRRRAKPDFLKSHLSPNNEKFYRLYLYQGVSIPDRLTIHTEGLEVRMQIYWVFGMSIFSGCTMFGLLGGFRHAKDRTMLKMAAGCTAAIFTWDFLRRYYRTRFEAAIEPFYAKYGIK